MWSDPRPHLHRLDTQVGDESRVLVEGPHFGVAWCVNAPPRLPPALHDVQLLPIDAAAAGIESWRMRPDRRR